MPMLPRRLTRRSRPMSSRTIRSPTQTPSRPHRSRRTTANTAGRNARKSRRRHRHMGEQQRKNQELTDEELEQQEAAELRDREAMSLVNANVAAPINAAVALNALSDASVAVANAQQTAPITQSNG